MPSVEYLRTTTALMKQRQISAAEADRLLLSQAVAHLAQAIATAPTATAVAVGPGPSVPVFDKASEAELLDAYHRTSLHRGGISFTRALLTPGLRAALELGVAMLRNPPPKRFDAKRAQSGDLEE